MKVQNINNNTSFCSTYRVPLKQVKSVKPSKKDALKELAQKWNGIVPKYREGNVKFSVPKRYDTAIEGTLNKLGFNKYQVVPLHRVPKEQLVDALNYEGRFTSKNPNPSSKPSKETLEMNEAFKTWYGE